MAVTQYQCTICKRVRDVLDDGAALTITTKCTITQGCRGSLVATRRLPSATREVAPPALDGLTDWQPRVVLYQQTQKIASTKWRIAHTLNVPFVIDVVLSDGSEPKFTDYTATYESQNLVTLTFSAPRRGTVQLIARNGSRSKVFLPIDEDQLVQISQQGRIVFFDASAALNVGLASYTVELHTPDGTVYSGNQDVTTDGVAETSWNVNGVLFNDITSMKTFALQLSNLFILPAIGTIPDGSRLSITQVFGRTPKRHEVMLGRVKDTSASGAFNRNKDSVVDVSRAVNGIILRNGEAYVYQSDIESVVPPLRILT